MFVGETGIGRIVRRTLEVMQSLGTDDPDAVRAQGAIDLPTLQRYINFWFSSSLDLFGSETSSNAAAYFAAGLKGRPDEGTFEDHVCLDTSELIAVPDEGGGVREEEVPTRNAMNEITRNLYVKDCAIGITRWNRTIKRAGFDAELFLPSTRFRRTIGRWSGTPVTPDGTPMANDLYRRLLPGWLPSEEDRAYIRSLMHAVTEPGLMAGWIAPPARGIDGKPVDYEYVKLH